VRLGGRVLCARPGQRLSYLLHAHAEDPPVYLTWLIRGCESGTVVSLQVDEIDCPDSAAEAEEAWLPILAALQRQLAGD
jgi:hypothetical protein